MSNLVLFHLSIHFIIFTAKNNAKQVLCDIRVRFFFFKNVIQYVVFLDVLEGGSGLCPRATHDVAEKQRVASKSI